MDGIGWQYDQAAPARWHAIPWYQRSDPVVGGGSARLRIVNLDDLSSGDRSRRTGPQGRAWHDRRLRQRDRAQRQSQSGRLRQCGPDRHDAYPGTAGLYGVQRRSARWSARHRNITASRHQLPVGTDRTRRRIRHGVRRNYRASRQPRLLRSVHRPYRDATLRPVRRYPNGERG
jgi:hypothetical protein